MATVSIANRRTGANFAASKILAPLLLAMMLVYAGVAAAAQNNTGTWTLGTNTASNTVTVGSNTVTATVSFSAHSTATTTTAPITNETLNGIAVFNPSVQSTPSLGVQYNWDTAPEGGTTLASTDGGTAVMTITFSQAVKDPILHLDRIGGSDGANQNSSIYTLQTSGITLTRLSGTTHFSVSGSTITNNLSGTAIGSGYTAESSTTTNLGTAAGSVRLNGTFTTVSFLMAPATGTTEGGGGDAIEMKLTYDPTPVAQPDSFNGYVNITLSGNLYNDNGSGADADFNSDTLTLTQINGATYTVGTPIALANGSLTITNATTGAFTFAPTSGFSGIQTFTYRITDANGGTSTTTATITILRTTVQLRKISNGAVGSFGFTGTNGFGSDTIATATQGTPVSGAVKTLTAASTSTTVTETIPSTYFISAISCTGLGSGTATTDFTAGTIVLNSAATAPGNVIVCTYTNTLAVPGLTVVKSANTAGPVSLGNVITYTFQVTNSGNRPLSAVQVAESFNGTGTAPVVNNETLLTDIAPAGDSTDSTANNGQWTTLGPGDVVRFTATYAVTQTDIDTLQ